MSTSDRLFDNLTKEVDFLRSDSKSKNRIMEMIVKKFSASQHRRSSSSSSYNQGRSRPNGGSGGRSVNVDQAYQYPPKNNFRSNNNNNDNNNNYKNNLHDKGNYKSNRKNLDKNNNTICEGTWSEGSDTGCSDTSGCSSEDEEGACAIQVIKPKPGKWCHMV